MRELTRIQEAVFREPWAITDSMMLTIAGVVDTAIREGAAMRMPEPAQRPQMQFIGGVPVIQVSGVISKKANMLSDISGGTSIDSVRSQFQQAMATDALAVFLSFDTPGGGVPGVAEMATEIWQARQTGGKTIIACIDTECCSAGYWMASQCDMVYLTEASTAGSIGIVATMQDNTRQLANQGVDTKVFRSSELKAPGNGPLSPNQMASIQDRIMAYTEIFRSAVMRGRDGTGLDLISFDPGATFIGQKAVDMGLCDGVSTLEAEIIKYQKK